MSSLCPGYCWCALLILLLDQLPNRARTFFPWKKKCTYGGTHYIFFSVTSCPRDASPLIRFSGGLSNTRCAPSLSLIPLCSVKPLKMVNSLEALVLYAVLFTVVLDLLQAVWHPPLRNSCVSALFRRSTTEELTRLAKTLPWDHPIARTLDHEVHRRKMGGKSCHFCCGARPGVHSFPHTLFFIGLQWCSQISTFVGKSFGPPTFALDDVD